jgi:hypothetical protein
MGTDPFGALTVFFTQMIGLSVAAERVTETGKQWLGSAMLTKLGPDRVSGVIQSIAIVSGVLVTALSGLNPMNIPEVKPFDWGNKADWLSWIITGILVSGGSAFWNHLLDILKATKVQKEQQVNNAVQAGSGPLIAP